MDQEHSIDYDLVSREYFSSLFYGLVPRILHEKNSINHACVYYILFFVVEILCLLYTFVLIYIVIQNSWSNKRNSCLGICLLEEFSSREGRTKEEYIMQNTEPTRPFTRAQVIILYAYYCRPKILKPDHKFEIGSLRLKPSFSWKVTLTK